MIQAKDLRIANWVSHNKEYGIIEVIYPNGAIVIYKGLPITLVDENIEPIPLTEEILLKCGFECIEKDNSGGDYRHRNYKWFQFFFNSKSILKYGAFTQLIHLHQLQNLIHALTGKELDIDLSR